MSKINNETKSFNNLITETCFYIIDETDPTKTLFSTMGGYKFYDHAEKNGEWQSRYVFKTQEEAEQKIETLYSEGRLLDLRLCVQKFTRTTMNVYEQFEPKMTPVQHKQHLCTIQQEKFEMYMAQNTAWSSPAVKRERTKSGYKHKELNAAFEVFNKLNNSIPVK